MSAPHSWEIPAHRRAATHADLANYFRHGSHVMTENPFGGPSIYVSSIHNRFFLANERWNSVLERKGPDGETVNASDGANLFDGNYDSYTTMPDGGSIELNLTFPNMHNGWLPGYSYGDFILSFYHTYTTSDVECWVYSEYQDQGWVQLNGRAVGSPYSGATGDTILAFASRIYRIEHIRIIVKRTPDMAPDDNVWLSQFEFYNDRPGTNEMPTLTKYRDQFLYRRLSWRNHEQSITAFVDEDGTAEFGRLRSAAGPTANRPTGVGVGTQYFDTTINRPIWWDGGKWVDATGTAV